MSINCILTSNKTQFKNYFQDSITLPANSNVALTKLSLDVPIFVQTYTKVPIIPLANRGNTCLIVNIDGIEQVLTWTDLFTAFAEYPDIGALGLAEQDMTADDFFSGNYEFFMNNRLFLNDGPGATATESRCPFEWMLATAISNKFDFYSAVASTEYEEKYSGVPADQTLNAVYIAGPTEWDFSNVKAVKPIMYNINIAYDVEKITTNVTLIPATFDATDLLTFTFTGGATPRLNSVNGSGVNVACFNDADLELNGGYIKCTPTVPTGGVGAFGLSLEGRSINDEYIPKTYNEIAQATAVIDIGIQFEEFTQGATQHRVYKIIDGQDRFVLWDSGTNNVVEGTLSKFKPYDALASFTNANDEFLIRCRRGNIINSNYEYVFDIMIGDGDDISNYNSVYTTTRTLNNSAIRPVPMFVSNDITNVVFNNIQIIPIGTDTTAQGNSFNITGGAFFNTAKIQVAPNNITDDNNGGRDFFNAFGLNYYISGGDPADKTMPMINTYKGTPLNKTISWKPSINLNDDSQQILTRYWIGETILSEIYVYNPVINSWIVNQNNSLITLPKYLNVSLVNHTNKNYSGSFISTLNNQALGGFNEGEDKIIGTAPLDLQDEDGTTVASIKYETFNPYYRPMNNPNPLVTNEMIIEISYKDFNTDVKKFINNILGFLKLEINFTKSVNQNFKRITGINDTVPII